MLLNAILDLQHSPRYRNSNNNSRNSNNNDQNNNFFYICSNLVLWTFIQRFETKTKTFRCALWNEAKV